MDVLEAIELNEGYSYLPQIWSDIVLFDYTRKPDVMEKILTIMKLNKNKKVNNIVTYRLINVYQVFLHVISFPSFNASASKKSPKNVS